MNKDRLRKWYHDHESEIWLAAITGTAAAALGVSIISYKKQMLAYNTKAPGYFPKVWTFSELQMTAIQPNPLDLYLKPWKTPEAS